MLGSRASVMFNIVVALLCLARAGHGRRVQAPSPSTQGIEFLKNLLVKHPAAAFSASGPGGAQIRAQRPGKQSPQMRLFGQPADGKTSTNGGIELKGQNLDFENSDTLQSMTNYANAFREQGETEHDHTADEKRDILDLRSRVLGPNHADTLRALTDYGATKSGAHHQSQAEASLREMLEESRQALKQRCEQEAAADIALMKDILELKLNRIGADHPETLTSLSNYADTLADCGKHDEAARMKRQLVDIRQQMLGPEHSDSLAAVDSYADTLDELDRAAQAEPLRKEAYQLKRLTLGPGHSETLKALNSYATTLSKLGRHVEAEPLWKDLVELARQNLGPKHPDTIRASKIHANTLKALGLHVEADPMETILDKYADQLNSLSSHAKELGVTDSLFNEEQREPVAA